MEEWGACARAVIVIGVGATLTMDLWSALLRSMGVRTLDYAMLGRWLGHALQGICWHSNIQNAVPIRGEALTGWLLHYLSGIVLAAGLVWWQGAQWSVSPTLLPALAWGAISVLLPWLLLQPALGAGIAASRLPAPWRQRALGLLSHLVFGWGLFVTAGLLKWWE